LNLCKVPGRNLYGNCSPKNWRKKQQENGQLPLVPELNRRYYEVLSK